MGESWPFLSLARFKFILEVTTLMILPGYKGSVFRGAFGRAFREVVCRAPSGKECTACRFRAQCIYKAFFEPSPPSVYPDANKFNSAPAPYILNPPLSKCQAFYPGNILEFELVLVGRAIVGLPHFIYAFMEAGRRGLGGERGKYRVLRVDWLDNGTPIPVYSMEADELQPWSPQGSIRCDGNEGKVESIRLHFLTPLRIKEKGDLLTSFVFPLFFERLTQRITLLTAFYGNGKGSPNFSGLERLVPEIVVSSSALHWYEWGRYSHRQNSSMKLGGLRGEVRLTGELGPFMAILRLGEQINVGQSTTFGLGRYEIHT